MKIELAGCAALFLALSSAQAQGLPSGATPLTPTAPTFAGAFNAPGGPLVIANVANDGYVGTDGSIPYNSTLLTSASRPCVSTDFGKVVVVAGGGAPDGSSPLHSTVTACDASHRYVLADTNKNTSGLSSDMWSVATDVSATLNTLVANNPNSYIVLPCGVLGLDASTVALNRVRLQGCGIPGPTNNLTTALTSGTLFAITTNSTTQPAFTVSRSVRTSDFNIVYPGNYGVTATPVAYGPTFSDNGSNILTGWNMDHVTALNPYDFFKQNQSANGGSGYGLSTIHWENVKAYPLDHFIDVVSLSSEFSLEQVQENANVATAISTSGYGGAA